MPWVIPVIAIGLSAASIAMSAKAASDAGDEKAAQSYFQAEQAEKAAETSERNARLVQLSGAREELRAARETQLVVGDIRAQMGATGVTMDGTPQAYIEMQAARGASNVLAIRYQSDLRAQALREDAKNYRGQRDQFLRAAQNNIAIGQLNAVGTGLAGGAQILNQVGALTASNSTAATTSTAGTATTTWAGPDSFSSVAGIA